MVNTLYCVIRCGEIFIPFRGCNIRFCSNYEAIASESDGAKFKKNMLTLVNILLLTTLDADNKILINRNLIIWCELNYIKTSMIFFFKKIKFPSKNSRSIYFVLTLCIRKNDMTERMLPFDGGSLLITSTQGRCSSYIRHVAMSIMDSNIFVGSNSPITRALKYQVRVLRSITSSRT